MNLNDYMALEAQVEALYTDLEQARTTSEADGIQRKIDILEFKIENILNIDNNRYVEEEEY